MHLGSPNKAVADAVREVTRVLKKAHPESLPEVGLCWRFCPAVHLIWVCSCTRISYIHPVHLRGCPSSGTSVIFNGHRIGRTRTFPTPQRKYEVAGDRAGEAVMVEMTSMVEMQHKVRSRLNTVSLWRRRTWVHWRRRTSERWQRRARIRRLRCSCLASWRCAWGRPTPDSWPAQPPRWPTSSKEASTTRCRSAHYTLSWHASLCTWIQGNCRLI